MPSYPVPDQVAGSVESSRRHRNEDKSLLVIRATRHLYEEKQVLDLYSGRGERLKLLATMADLALGVGRTESEIAPGLEIVEGAINDLPAEDDAVDAVFIPTTALPSLRKAANLEEISRVIGGEGVAVVELGGSRSKSAVYGLVELSQALEAQFASVAAYIAISDKSGLSVQRWPLANGAEFDGANTGVFVVASNADADLAIETAVYHLDEPVPDDSESIEGDEVDTPLSVEPVRETDLQAGLGEDADRPSLDEEPASIPSAEPNAEQPVNGAIESANGHANGLSILQTIFQPELSQATVEYDDAASKASELTQKLTSATAELADAQARLGDATKALEVAQSELATMQEEAAKRENLAAQSRLLSETLYQQVIESQKDTWLNQHREWQVWSQLPRASKRLARHLRRRIPRALLGRSHIGRALLLISSGLGLPQDGVSRLQLFSYAKRHQQKLKVHPLFDQEYYIEQARDVQESGMLLALHYLWSGDHERRSPHPLFDVAWYKNTYQEALKNWKLTALEHFLIHGARDGMNPGPLFDVQYYIGQAKTLHKTGQNPLAHYVLSGWRDGLNPHPLFDNDWYIENNVDVLRRQIPPLVHYLQTYRESFADPHPLFSTRYYLEQHRDVNSARINPLVHYVTTGWREGRRPSDYFDPKQYLACNPDVDSAGLEPLSHYLLRGAWEQREITPDFDPLESVSGDPKRLISGRTPLELVAIADLASRKKREVVQVSQPLQDRDFEVAPGGLFETLHESARERDPRSYDWHGYSALRGRLDQAEKSRIETLELPVPELINIDTAKLVQAASQIRFEESQSPEVTILIPVYNQLKYTLECLQSLANTKCDVSFEVLIADDGSTDGSKDILRQVRGVKYVRNESNLGFLRNVNGAAKKATAQRLIILNNDVQVHAEWLAPLMKALDDPTIGVAAPKMLFPNGRLQEAGARLKRDGGSVMIGLFDDPNLPRYSYSRDVDYVSGACIALRTQEFVEFGGFDERYAPAYCEDCDLCLKYTDKGFRIRYVANSKIYHHLSVSSNAESDDFKMSQIYANQQKITERWGEKIDRANDVRVLSFYLPQFHAVPENDRWWGPGFTEWTNVQRALPNFRGHYQPHRPAELGFYDLTNTRVMEKQIELARNYGVHGFCFYYYSFSGRRILETPLENILANPALDIPFCVCWANENWTKTWDGQEENVLLSQRYEPKDDAIIIRDIVRHIRSENYIRINGKPLVIVYRPQLLPNARATTELWRTICQEEGVGEIYLAYVEVLEGARAYNNPALLGFDASIEFPPSGFSIPTGLPGPKINPEYKGTVTDYRSLVERYLQEPVPGFTRFRGAMPSWDNTARRQDQSYVFHHASPGNFQAWLESIVKQTLDQNHGDERLVFVNAWNEWAEGAHLEPDTRFGRGWLEAIRNALDSQDLLGS